MPCVLARQKSEMLIVVAIHHYDITQITSRAYVVEEGEVEPRVRSMETQLYGMECYPWPWSHDPLRSQTLLVIWERSIEFAFALLQKVILWCKTIDLGIV